MPGTIGWPSQHIGDTHIMTNQNAGASQPAINAPTVVLVLAAVFIAAHVWQTFLTEEEQLDFLLTYSFIPARYATTGDFASFAFPGGIGADIWTFVTYMFLHADWVHLAVNGFWMLAFGSVVARRMGAVMFFVFSAICAVAGAALHLGLYWAEPVPMIGASAAISGQMAGAVRFIFSRPSNLLQASRMRTEHLRADSLMQVFSNPRALAFLGVWIGINAFFGLTSSVFSDQQIAWEAHLGGFVAGLLLFGLFDRYRAS